MIVKPKSFLFGSTVALTFFIITPICLILLNSILSLPIVSFTISKLLGLALFLLGILLFLYCSKLFVVLGKGTPIPLEPPNKLVVDRLYKRSRNPIYIGYFLIFFGIFFFFGHFLLFLYSIFSIFGLNYYVVHFEEPALAKRFGKDYTEYCRTTPRWI